MRIRRLMLNLGIIYTILALSSFTFKEDECFQNTCRSYFDGYLEDKLIACQDQSEIVYISELFPFLHWDEIIVFPYYYTVKQKTDAVGYTYSNYLCENCYEGMLSFVLLMDGKVVYNMDGLVSWNSRIVTNSGINWIYIGRNSKSTFDRASIDDNPYFLFERLRDEMYSISLGARNLNPMIHNSAIESNQGR